MMHQFHGSDKIFIEPLDQRGHGDSEWPPQWAYGTRHYAADLEALIDNWGLGGPVLVGHSMGAHNTLVAATRHPEKLGAIVAIDTPPDYSQRAVDFLKGMSEKPARRFDSFEEAIANFRLLPRETSARKEILEHAHRLTFKRTADGGWTNKLDRRTMVREPLDIWDELGKITCPALVIKLLRSPVFDREAARKMAAAMPRGKYAEIDSYHHVTFDHPEALVAVLESFLKEIG